MTKEKAKLLLNEVVGFYLDMHEGDSAELEPKNSEIEESEGKITPENLQTIRDAYDHLTSESVLTTDHKNTIELRELSIIYPNLAKLVSKANENDVLKATLADFIIKSINNINIYGEILDTAGSDNIIFSKAKTDNWSYVLADAIYPSAAPAEGRLKQVQSILLKYGHNKTSPLSGEERNDLMNILNHIRSVNIIANSLGLSERVNLLRKGMSLTPEDLLRAIQL
mgnify:CR=1 FL=1